MLLQQICRVQTQCFFGSIILAMPLASSKENCFQISGTKVTFKLNEIQKSMQFFCMLIFHTVFASYLKFGLICLFGTIACATLFLTSYASKVSIENSNLVLQVPFLG